MRTKEQQEENRVIRSRIILAKAELPYRDISGNFIEDHPEYNSYKEVNRVKNMLSGRSIEDIELVNKFLQWAKLQA